MAKAGYTVQTTAAVALVAATAKTVLTINAPATFGVDLKSIRLSFDGVSAANTPVTVELCQNTLVSAGTSTAVTVVQQYGRTIVAGFTSGYNYTAEPTVLTVVERYLISPNSTTFAYDYPLGSSPDLGISVGFALRLTAPAAVNAWAGFVVERC